MNVALLPLLLLILAKESFSTQFLILDSAIPVCPVSLSLSLSLPHSHTHTHTHPHAHTQASLSHPHAHLSLHPIRAEIKLKQPEKNQILKLDLHPSPRLFRILEDRLSSNLFQYIKNKAALCSNSATALLGETHPFLNCRHRGDVMSSPSHVVVVVVVVNVHLS